MKSLLVFTALLAVGLAEESKAPVVVANPYLYGYPGYGYYGHGAPLAYGGHYAPHVAAAPVPVTQTYAPAYAFSAPVAPVPAPAISSQFAAQDEFGNSQYGYSNLNSAKHEVGNAYTGVSGSYQYVDAAGKLQTVNYVADHLGFRVQDSRIPVHVAELPEAPVHNAELPVAPVHEYELPVAPVYNGVAPVAPVYDGVAPEPVEDTPEVAAAKAEFLAAFEEVKNREKRESDPMAFNAYGYNSLYAVNPRFTPWAYNGLYAYNKLGHYNNYMGHPGFSYGFYYKK